MNKYKTVLNKLGESVRKANKPIGGVIGNQLKKVNYKKTLSQMGNKLREANKPLGSTIGKKIRNYFGK